MACSLREPSRKEQSIAPKNAFFGPIGTKKRAKILFIRVLLVSQKRLDFVQAKERFFSVFLEALYFGHFVSFYTMQLEPPKYVGHSLCKWKILCG